MPVWPLWDEVVLKQKLTCDISRILDTYVPDAGYLDPRTACGPSEQMSGRERGSALIQRPCRLNDGEGALTMINRFEDLWESAGDGAFKSGERGAPGRRCRCIDGCMASRTSGEYRVSSLPGGDETGLAEADRRGEGSAAAPEAGEVLAPGCPRGQVGAGRRRLIEPLSPATAKEGGDKDVLPWQNVGYSCAT